MRKLLFVFLITVFVFVVLPIFSSFAQNKILMIIANRGFRDEEFFTPYNFFKKEGFKVIVASNKTSTASGMLGGRFLPDINISDIGGVDGFAAVVLPGGIGSTIFWSSKKVKYIIKEAYKQGKIIGALCLSPVTLAKAGILTGKKATVWPSEAEYLRSKGVVYIDTDVVVDGNIVTASGPQAADKFAREVVGLLRSKR